MITEQAEEFGKEMRDFTNLVTDGYEPVVRERAQMLATIAIVLFNEKFKRYKEDRELLDEKIEYEARN